MAKRGKIKNLQANPPQNVFKIYHKQLATKTHGNKRQKINQTYLATNCPKKNLTNKKKLNYWRIAKIGIKDNKKTKKQNKKTKNNW